MGAITDARSDIYSTGCILFEIGAPFRENPNGILGFVWCTFDVTSGTTRKREVLLRCP